MQITKLSGERFELAIDRFQNGDHILFDKASFVLINDDIVHCNYQSTWNPENLDKKKAKDDFKAAMVIFNFLKENSEKFNQLVKNRNLEISLIDNYGMGAIELASLKHGEYDWKYIKK